MQKPPGIQYFEDLEDKIEAAVKTLRKDVSAGNPAMLESLQDLLVMFDKRGLSIKQNTDNIRLLNEMSKRVSAIMSDGALPKATRKLLQNFPGSSELIDGYFSNMLSSGFRAGKPVYQAITEFYTNYTANALIGQGVNEQFKQGIVNILRQSVKNGISTIEAKEMLAKYVVKDDLLARNVSQVASDALHQYSREYTQALTDDLGLEHYYYKGTKIETTRPFCSAKVGKYFTEKEVEKWATQDWAGKIDGTNKSNIRTLLGGYNCRHNLVPVSKAVYDARVNATKPV